MTDQVTNTKVDGYNGNLMGKAYNSDYSTSRIDTSVTIKSTPDEPVNKGQWGLELCPKCNQMTNHNDDGCLKCRVLSDEPVNKQLDSLLGILNIRKGGITEHPSPANEHYYLNYEYTDFDTEQTSECKVNYQTEVKEFKQSILGLINSEKVKELEQVDRFEVIDDTGRAYVKGSIYGTPVSVKLSYQDDNRTLKVFVTSQIGEQK